MLRFLLVAAAAGALGAGAAAGADTRASSGLFGQVLVSPAFPVCSEDRPCTAPARHVVLAFRRGGRLAARTATDRNGRYRVALPPGRYRVLAPRVGGVGRGLDPTSVSVPRSRYARVNFTLDVGIR